MILIVDLSDIQTIAVVFFNQRVLVEIIFFKHFYQMLEKRTKDMEKKTCLVAATNVILL